MWDQYFKQDMVRHTKPQPHLSGLSLGASLSSTGWNEVEDSSIWKMGFSKGRGVLFFSIFFVFEVDQILLNGSGSPIIIIYFSEPFFNTLKISILYWLNYFVGFFWQNIYLMTNFFNKSIKHKIFSCFG